MTDKMSEEPTVRPTHSVIVPLNDLEAVTIVRLVDALNKGVGKTCARPKAHTLSHGWGGRAILDETTIDDLALTVILVETPDEAIAHRLQRSDRTVVPVDHHIYATASGSLIDRRSPLSSLEQVMRFLDVDPSALPSELAGEIPLVAANDRGFIPQLAKVALNSSKTSHEARARVEDIRCRDLTIARLAAKDPSTRPDILKLMGDQARWQEALKATSDQIDAARMAYREAYTNGQARWLDLDGVPSKDAGPRLLLARLPETHRYVMADAIYWEMCGDDAKALEQPIEMLLVFYKTETRDSADPTNKQEEREILTRIEFSGASDRRDQVAQWFDPQVRKCWSAAIGRLECFAGGGDSAYFGASDPLGGHESALSDLVNCLLGDLLTGNRPVSAWRTSFVQALALGDPLDRHLEEEQEAVTCLRALGLFLRRRADRDQVDEPDAPPVSDLKRRILDHLERWRARVGDGSPRPEPLPIGEEERHYFLPHLRDLMAWRPSSDDAVDPWDQALNAIREGRALVSIVLPPEGLTFRVRRGGYEREVALPIRDLRLHFFYNDVLLVEWSVAEPEGGPAKGKVTWPDLLKADHPAVGRPLGQVIDLNAKLRFTHSTYCSNDGVQGQSTAVTLTQAGWDRGTLRHGAAVSDSPFIGWYLALLEFALGLNPDDFAPDGALGSQSRVRALFDDRARVITSVVPLGRLPTTPQGRAAFDVMLARLTTVDPYGTGHTCDPAFALNEYRTARYGRYLSWGTHYMATSHSFVCLAMDGDDDYARTVIHGIHMPTMYRRMALVAQGYVAVLGAFSLQVSDALTLSSKKPTQEQRQKTLTTHYHHLHRGQLEFTNHIWFEHINSQIQGVELFECMSRQTRSEAEYRMVRDEIQQMQDFLSAEEDARKNDMIADEERRERTIAAIALPFAVLFAVLGSQQIADHFFLWPLLEKGTQGLGLAADFTWLLASVLSLATAFTVALAVSPRLFKSWPWIGRNMDDKNVRNDWQKLGRCLLAGGTAVLFALGLMLQSGGIIALETSTNADPTPVTVEQSAG
jgi:hypothetical protein